MPAPPITPLCTFSDNYVWLIAGPNREAAVVDPGDAGPVLAWLQREGLKLRHILITHKHADHTGGIHKLKQAFPDTRIYGPHNESIAGVTHPVAEGEQILLPGFAEPLTTLETPGHTEGHLAWYGEGVLFCGDTLFASGCGRVFSGTHGQMAASLGRLAQLPPATRVYCAHEYTEANIGFARWVEPHNQKLLTRAQQVAEQIAHQRPTVPSTLQLELETNPFLRTQHPDVVAAAEQWAGHKLEGAEARFRALRDWKDQDYD